MQRPELGSGWRYPVQLNERGGIATSSEAGQVREAITLILSTAKGERIRRPEFGCDLHDFVFATLSQSTLTLVKSAVCEALQRWEKRIELDGVDVEPEIDAGRLMIRVRYRIRSTNFQ